MSSELPLVSVLMTAYNREKYIGAAIESVLASTYSNFELIITDDCSSDNTVQIARDYASKDPRVKVFVNEKNLGDYPNRNRAASHASGKYLKYLDADDMIYYYGLEVMVSSMEQFPQAGFGLGARPDNMRPHPILLSPRESYQENFHGWSHFDRAPGSSIIRADAFQAAGGFSGKRMIGDFELWFKMARMYPMVKFSMDLYWNRLHDEQESKSGYAKLYPVLRKQVLAEALAHPDCPMSADEISLIKRMVKKEQLKHGVVGGLRRIRGILKN